MTTAPPTTSPFSVVTESKYETLKPEVVDKSNEKSNQKVNKPNEKSDRNVVQKPAIAPVDSDVSVESDVPDIPVDSDDADLAKSVCSLAVQFAELQASHQTVLQQQATLQFKYEQLLAAYTVLYDQTVYQPMKTRYDFRHFACDNCGQFSCEGCGKE